jgi:hypothetical protein
MRELVYLSDRKLAAFLPDPPPWWRRLGQRATFEIATPVATVGIGAQPAPTADAARLSRFSATVAEIERTARWFAEPGLEIGQWVQFEARMAWTVASFGFEIELDYLAGAGEPAGGPRRGGTGIAMFVDVEEDDPRLVLHGSPQHLMEHAAANSEVTWGHAPIGSAPSTLRRFIDSATRNALDKPETGPRRATVGNDLLRAMTQLRETRQLAPSTGEWLGGYARLTDRYDDIVCATPLYVQRMPPPQN